MAESVKRINELLDQILKENLRIGVATKNTALTNAELHAQERAGGNKDHDQLVVESLERHLETLKKHESST
jgi:hypothetical protein